jgi:MOSC domain
VSGRVESVNIADEGSGATRPVDSINAIAGQGLEGDRYFTASGTFSKNQSSTREITLIEAEAVDALRDNYGIELDPKDSRRNIVTRDVPLNHLVGRRFRVGEALLEGVKLCEPCSHLESLTQPGVKKGLVHRGGLRARILESGSIRTGDAISFEAD